MFSLRPDCLKTPARQRTAGVGTEWVPQDDTPGTDYSTANDDDVLICSISTFTDGNNKLYNINEIDSNLFER